MKGTWVPHKIADINYGHSLQVLDVDGEAQRMSLSLKAAIAKPEKTGDGAGDKAEAEEPPRPLAVPKRSGPLKGGVRGKAGSGGEQFGLKW